MQDVKDFLKQQGVKGFRKLRLKRPVWVAGKQCQRLDRQTALAVIEGIEALGYRVAQRNTTIELAQKGLLDTISIEG